MRPPPYPLLSSKGPFYYPAFEETPSYQEIARREVVLVAPSTEKLTKFTTLTAQLIAGHSEVQKKLHALGGGKDSIRVVSKIESSVEVDAAAEKQTPLIVETPADQVTPPTPPPLRPPTPPSSGFFGFLRRAPSNIPPPPASKAVSLEELHASLSDIVQKANHIDQTVGLEEDTYFGPQLKQYLNDNHNVGQTDNVEHVSMVVSDGLNEIDSEWRGVVKKKEEPVKRGFFSKSKKVVTPKPTNVS